ncbi:MAG TPA: VOC family protein [Mycobacterium sp.]|nr:VOC family protein [Mycobacterium sp.]
MRRGDALRRAPARVPECARSHARKNRVHLDFSAQDVDAEVSRLTAAGATEVGRRRFSENFRWVVLADPEGNVFCVAGQ